jgi:murein endopeptidase
VSFSLKPAVLAAVLLLFAAALASCGDGQSTPVGDAPAPKHAAPEHQAPKRTAPEREEPETMLAEPIRWRRSTAVGQTNAGRLANGVQLPSEGEEFFTWDPIRRTVPNRGWRRWGTDRLIRVVLRVVREFRAAHPGAPRVAVGDLSRPRGGNFGPQYGAPGHASHQNGLDVDVYYPRQDGREREPASVAQVDRRLAQDLVDRFVREGAKFVFVGLHVGLRGPRRIVQAIPNHDNHLHVRIR